MDGRRPGQRRRFLRRLFLHGAGSAQEAAERAEQRGWEIAEAQTSKLVATLAENGMQVDPAAPAPVEAGFQSIGQTMSAEWLSKAGADGQAIIDAYKN